MGKKDQIGLLALQEAIAETLSEAFCEDVWVRAEISELKENRNGHCYLTLVEKDADSAAVLAKAQAVIWASSYRMVKPYFESETGTPLAVGMEVLLQVHVQYSEVYGLSLMVTDIDPSFTLGALEAERRRTLERLQKEGMFDMNTSLTLSALPRRFAVISAENAAGYRDFMKQLHENECGFSFETDLFPSPMQGTECPSGIIAALEKIAASEKVYDAVLILRGGGGAMDLACFDDYSLAVNVAQFPIPVLTGIGHDHDYHVIDMVAYANVKTPTALADFIIDIFEEQMGLVDALSRRLNLAVMSIYAAQEAAVDALVSRIGNALSSRLLSESHRIERLELRIGAADPESVLEKGYAMVLKNGKKVTAADSVKKGDRVKIILSQGSVDAEIL